MHRSQQDATSPWMWMERKSEEVCPECLYERKNWPLFVARGDERMSEGMVVSWNLLRAIRAVVIENAGNLEKVMVDSRQRPPTTGAARRLAGNLTKVSQAVAKLDPIKEQHPIMSPRIHHDQPRNLMLDIQPQLQQAAARTVPELLSYLDQMAKDMHLDLASPLPPPPAIAAKNARRQTQSLLFSEDAEPLLTPRPADCAELEKEYWAARRQTVPKAGFPATPPSVYVTAPTSRKPSLQTMTSKTEAPKLNLPSAILRASDISPRPSTPPFASLTTYTTASSTPYPLAVKPALRKSPLPPQKRVRAMDVWPPARDREILPPEKTREQEQRRSTVCA